jgi:hypothetical protein
MGFDFRHVTQNLQQTYAVNRAAGTAEPNNESFHDFRPY